MSGGEGSPEAFPTLADLLAEGSLSDQESPLPLTVLVERCDDAARVKRVVPNGSAIVDVSGVGPASGSATDAPRAPAACPRVDSLDDLLELAREKGCDVLVVSDGDLLTAAVLRELRTTLAVDSACASVSVTDASVARIQGVPPAGVVGPRRGVVLIRLDHLLLALDEAAFVGRDDVGLIRLSAGAGLAGRVLASLDRPGFVHRAVGSEVCAPATATPTPRGSPRGARAARIVVDGRCFAQPLSGTQVQVIGLVGGLARAGADVAVLRPSTLHPTVASEIDRLSTALPLVERSSIGRPDVFHRPFQVRSLHELADCLSMGERLVLTHQDMILDRTRAYANAVDSWHDYRVTTAASLSSADEVGFFSRHAALDAASEGALELDRATVVPLGVDHLARATVDDTSVTPLGGRPFMLVVGNSFWHKNRLFAVRLLRRLVETGAWDGGLVLAGGHPARGSSRAAEQTLLADSPMLGSLVVDLGHVSDAVQGALYRSAELVLFPSLYEGFGLIPFEAASVGTASVYAHRASMRELLPAIGALPSFDIEEAGAFVLGLLQDRAARSRVVAEIGAAARTLTWDRTAAGYLEVYERALAREQRGVSRVLVSLPPKSPRVTDQELLVLDVYRRRRGFRLAVDGLIRSGSIGLRAARMLRDRKSSR